MLFRSENPVAAALMAKMRIKKNDRPKVKAECLRLLVTLKLDPSKTQLISKFVDTYLNFEGAEEEQFQAEIAKLEVGQKEEIMEVMTSWERKGIEKGVEREKQTIALNMLRDNFSVDQVSKLTGLSLSQVQQLQSQEAVG